MAQERDWRRTKGQTKPSSAGFAARDKRKYPSSLPRCCPGERGRHIRNGAGAGEVHSLGISMSSPHPGLSTQLCEGPSAGKRFGTQGSHVPSVPRKGPHRDTGILQCLEKPGLRPASFSYYAALPFHISEEKVLSEKFVLAEVALWRRTWKPHFKHSSFFYLYLVYTDMKLISSQSLKDLIPYSFVTVKRKKQEANLTTMWGSIISITTSCLNEVCSFKDICNFTLICS